jgi:hypothetical protein
MLIAILSALPQSLPPLFLVEAKHYYPSKLDIISRGISLGIEESVTGLAARGICEDAICIDYRV